MKKLNPKISKIVIAILSVLIAGGAAFAVKDALGETTAGPDGGGVEGTGLW